MEALSEKETSMRKMILMAVAGFLWKKFQAKRAAGTPAAAAVYRRR